MFSNEERRKIEDEIKAGISTGEIRIKYHVSNSTLISWKRDIDIRRRAKALILDGRIEEAKAEIDKLEGEYNVLVRKALFAMIERRNGNIEGEKALLNEMRELEENNPVAIGMLIKVARLEGDIDEYRRLLDIKLQQEPTNTKIIISRERLARQEGDRGTERKMVDLELSLDPNNVEALHRKMRLAKEEKRLEEIADVGNRLLRINPNDKVAITAFRQYGLERAPKQEESMSDLKVEIQETEILGKAGAFYDSPVKRARMLIYAGQDIMMVSEEIKQIIEGESKLNRELILAELYFSIGLARKSTKIT